MCSYGTLPQIIQPTRVTPNTATIIANIFTNNITDDIICGNILLTFSEHLSQFVSVNRGKIDYKKINIYERDYSKFTVESFRDDLSIQNWDLTLDNVNDSFKDFHMKLEGAVNRHAPMRKLNPKEIKIKNKSWMTPHIVKQIKLRNKIFERKKRQPENENIQILFKQLRNRINREISKAKIKYYTQYFDEYKNNTKKIWEGIRKIVNLKKVSLKTSQLHIDGKIIDDDKDIATSLNTFFSKVGAATEENIPKVPNIPPSKFLRDQNRITFVIAHVSMEEVLDVINLLQNKSSGPYSIPFKLLMLMPDLLIIPLAHIINMSFNTGVYPDLLKIVKVIPIHKGGSTQEVNNFRPISLLPIFDKIMEKIMHKKLYHFLEENNILFKKQFGFRKNNSTVYALIEITEKIKKINR